MTVFTSLLVANRGEIALRIMRSARAAGLRCVAVFTDADADAPHVPYADEAINIGAGPVADSYLSIDAILAAARLSGAQAIHPGYGFLSENTDFARAVMAAGLVFVGPPPEAIELMGNKAAARRRMAEAGLPCVPGYDGADQSDATLRTQANQIGYPVMIKAAAGGGGRGMRLLGDAAGFDTALAQARAEALAAFGSDQMILEQAIERARHVEVQILADRHGNVLHLGERDCSVQRRHQKVIEESPCPVLSADQRAAMGAAAVQAARAVAYEGAGTVEFLLDPDGAFHFLEMNTRLQVEHTVTEAVTGRDLVALQLSVARGEPLGFAQGDVTFTGHAIEARLYAEDPSHDFLPATGTIARWLPGCGVGVRVDSGINEGQQVTPFYDPMLAKIIAHGATRDEARLRLIAALRETVLFGVPGNRDFLIRALSRPSFATGDATTAFIAEEFGARDPVAGAGIGDFALAAVVLYRHRQQTAAARCLGVPGEMLGWSSQGVLRANLRLGHGDAIRNLTLREDRDRTISVSDGTISARLVGQGETIRIDGHRAGLRAALVDGDTIHLALAERTLTFRHLTASGAATDSAGGGIVTAPMHGNLAEVLVSTGSKVEPGTRLAVLEAMKMRHELLAGVAGTVTRIAAAPGAQVKAGDVLIEIDTGEPAS